MYYCRLLWLTVNTGEKRLMGSVMLCVSANSISISNFTPALLAYLILRFRRFLLVRSQRSCLFWGHYCVKWWSSAWSSCFLDRPGCITKCISLWSPVIMTGRISRSTVYKPVSPLLPSYLSRLFISSSRISRSLKFNTKSNPNPFGGQFSKRP